MKSSINRLILAQFFNALYFAGPIVILFLLDKGFSLSQILLLSSILVVSGMLCEIPTGVFGDRYGRKWSLVMGSIVSVVTWILWLYTNSFLGFTLLYILFGLANAFYSGSDEALIYDELKSNGKEGTAQKVFSRYDAIVSIGAAVGALIGGVITPQHTSEYFGLPFILTLVAAIAGLVVAFTIIESPRSNEGDRTQEKAADMWADLAVGFKMLRENKKLLRILLFAVFTTHFALYDLFQPYFTQADVPTAWYGYALAISALVSAAAQWYAYKLEEWFGVERGTLIMTALPAVIWIAMAVTFGPVFAVLLFILGITGGSFSAPILSDYKNRHITGSRRATILSTLSLIGSAYIALMFPLIGWIADRSLTWAFILMAVIILMGIGFFRIRKDDVVTT